jgi:hypothetical protein
MTAPEQIPLFEGPAFFPLMPARNSAAEQALNVLMWAALQRLALRIWCAAPSRWWRAAK